ncbi:OLC1v1012069C1 [Oldenlandia corymbosa var. corymbosa]|uniref:OLC1v1012069C1 n=1 Tax=Oldenlandia corymbosa var. corymbosa TaxID=529605 RepID=A0AAV1DXH6_OLDCO|nr:OLC1v1012069C1 [Oldenlandia corymbosa var. corymbosa]
MSNPLGYAVELVMKAKSEVTEEYMKSNADFIALTGRRLPRIFSPWNHVVSDLTRVGFDEVDFGWGKPAFAGLAVGIDDVGQFINGVRTCYLPSKNKGEKGMLVPVCLPRIAMERFAQLIEILLKKRINEGDDDSGDDHFDFFNEVRSAL